VIRVFFSESSSDSDNLSDNLGILVVPELLRSLIIQRIRMDH